MKDTILIKIYFKYFLKKWKNPVLEHVKVIWRIMDSGTFFTARPANFTGIQSL